MFLVMGSIAGIAALAFFSWAAWSYFSQRRKKESRVTARGTVIELTTQVSDRGSIYCPIVEFTTSSGQQIRFTSDFGSRPASHKIGQDVSVRYDPTDPQQAEIESALTRWLYPVIFVFMGAIACCFSVAFLGVYGAGLSPY
jgi:hypothetical protein